MSEMSTEDTPVGRTKQISEHTSVTRPTVVPMYETENDVFVREYSSPHMIHRMAFVTPTSAASAYAMRSVGKENANRVSASVQMTAMAVVVHSIHGMSQRRRFLPKAKAMTMNETAAETSAISHDCVTQSSSSCAPTNESCRNHRL